MHTKAVFLDIDGTIVNMEGNIPPSAKTAILQAKANGHKMVLCTGRSRFQIYDELLALGFSGIVGAAGAFVDADGKEIFHAHIDEEHRKSSYDYLESNQFIYCYQADKGIVLNNRCKEGMIKVMRKRSMSDFRVERLIGNMQLTEEPWKNPTNEKIIYYDAPVPVNEVAKDLAPYFDVVAMSMGNINDYSGEIGINGIHKATGMEMYLQHVGIDKKDCIAVGDGANDLQMMEYAGISVAMGNATDEVKKRADMVTDHIDEDGLYHAFEKLGLI